MAEDRKMSKAQQKEPGGADEPPLLAAIHGGAGRGHRGPAPAAHLHDDEHALMRHHQVQFAEPAAEIAGERGEALALEVSGCHSLGR